MFLLDFGGCTELLHLAGAQQQDVPGPAVTTVRQPIGIQVRHGLRTDDAREIDHQRGMRGWVRKKGHGGQEPSQHSSRGHATLEEYARAADSPVNPW